MGRRTCAYAIAGLAVACGGALEPVSGVPTRPVRRVERELLVDAPSFEVRRGRGDAAPQVAVLSPSKDFRVKGADLLSLVLPPPAEVALELGDVSGLELDLAAGLDNQVMEAHADELAGCVFGFEARVGERVLFSARVPAEQVGRKPGTEWVTGQGLDLDRTEESRLTLITRFFDASGVERDPGRAFAAGFGGIELVRVTERPHTRSAPDAPNVLLIVMDTQRADRLSAYGYPRPTSPRLEELAARGVLFERAYSTSSWTWPSTASILTGLAPEEHGIVDRSSCFLPERLETLAEALQDQGFTSAGWSANYLVAADKNFDQGFEHYVNAEGASQPSGEVVPEVLDWIEAHAGTRFFAYVHLLDPHAPQAPLEEGRRLLAADVPVDFSPVAINGHRTCLWDGGGHTATGELVTERCVPPEEQRWMSELYDACTWSGDHWVGAILDRLEALGLLDETIVAFTSDHGEELLEHGLLTHGQSVHAELVHVPLILAGPGLPRGARVRGAVSNRSLAPTLARLAGACLSGAADAPDLLEPELRDSVPDAEGRAVYFSTAVGWWNGRRELPIYGLREGDRALHWAPGGAPWTGAAPRPQADGGAPGEWRLYDLASDPGETVDIAAREPETARRLLARLREHLTVLEARRTTMPIGAGDTTLERLRDIGYLGDE